MSDTFWETGRRDECHSTFCQHINYTHMHINKTGSLTFILTWQQQRRDLEAVCFCSLLGGQVGAEARMGKRVQHVLRLLLQPRLVVLQVLVTSALVGFVLEGDCTH